MNLRSALTLSLTLAALAFGLDAQGFEAKLRATSDVVLAGGTADLVLTLDITKTSQVPASLVSGLALNTTVNGKRGPKITERASGKVTFAGGTSLVRTISVDLKRITPNLNKDGVTRVTFEWAGLKGVAVTVNVAPDLKRVKIEDLDLAKTKVLLVTNYGDMVLKFHPAKAPNHVANFITLAKDGFYNGTRFHRVLRGFMIQGGCPNTKEGATGRPGTGSAPGGKTLKAEFNDTRHVKGILSMARTSDPNSAGCQFFIVHATASSLDNQYTAFGELVTGEDTLDKIAGVAVGGPERSTPKEPVHLKVAIVQPVFKQK